MQERRRIADPKIDEILKYIADGNAQRAVINDTLTQINIRCTNVELMIHGDSKAVDKYARDGINRRLESVENREKSDDKFKGNIVTIAVGAVAIAVGGAIIWLFDAL